MNSFSAHHSVNAGSATRLDLADLSALMLRRPALAGGGREPAATGAFNLRVPGSDEPAARTARTVAKRAAGHGRVLFMDDDEHICVLTGGMLERLGYTCDLVRNGGEAIRLYQRQLDLGRPYDVVIVDLNIVGGIGGEEVFRVLRELDPDVRAIVASGYDHDDKSDQLLDLGFRGYLTKPYRVVELDAMVRAALGR